MLNSQCLSSTKLGGKSLLACVAPSEPFGRFPRWYLWMFSLGSGSGWWFLVWAAYFELPMVGMIHHSDRKCWDGCLAIWSWSHHHLKKSLFPPCTTVSFYHCIPDSSTMQALASRSTACRKPSFSEHQHSLLTWTRKRAVAFDGRVFTPFSRVFTLISREHTLKILASKCTKCQNTKSGATTLMCRRKSKQGTTKGNKPLGPQSSEISHAPFAVGRLSQVSYGALSWPTLLEGKPPPFYLLAIQVDTYAVHMGVMGS